ncbi:hypothetical protein WMY93_027571 [Mugilogobius chulae]|uniref:Titin-like n=1 Tax=Mugilogobius chulae TaxID=88201 RepID=A0AAW0N3J0_9GOBI
METQAAPEIPEMFLTKGIPVIEAGTSYHSVSPPIDHELPSEESTMPTTETASETDVSKTKQKKKTRKHRKTSKDKDLGEEEVPSDFQEKPDSAEAEITVAVADANLVSTEEQELNLKFVKLNKLNLKEDTIQSSETVVEHEVSRQDPELKVKDDESQPSFFDLVKTAAKEITKGVENIFTAEISKTEVINKEQTLISEVIVDQSTALPESRELEVELPPIVMDDTQVEAVTDTQEDSAPHEVLPSEKDKEYVQDLFKNNVEIESRELKIVVCETEKPLTQPETDPVTAVQQDVQSIEEDKEMPLESEKDSVPIEPQELNTVVCEQMEAQSRTEIPELFLTKEIAVIEAGVSYQSVSPPVDHELASEENIVQIEPQELQFAVCEKQPLETLEDTAIESDVPSAKQNEIAPQEQDICDTVKIQSLPEDLEMTLTEEATVLKGTEAVQPLTTPVEHELSPEQGQQEVTETVSETYMSITKQKKKTKKQRKTSKGKDLGEEAEAEITVSEERVVSGEEQEVKSLIFEIEQSKLRPETETVLVPPEQVQPDEDKKETPLQLPEDIVQIEPQELKLEVCETMETQAAPEIPEMFLTKGIPVIEAGTSYHSVSPPIDHELPSEESTMPTTETASETDVSKTKQKKKTRKHRKTSKDKDLGKRKYPLTSKKNLILLKQKSQ